MSVRYEGIFVSCFFAISHFVQVIRLVQIGIGVDTGLASVDSVSQAA